MKKVKFKLLSGASSVKSDDYLVKAKPILGQNQIPVPALITEFTKKTHFLNEGIELSVILYKKVDKSIELDIKLTNIKNIIYQFNQNETVHLEQIQDLILIFQYFFSLKGEKIHENQVFTKIILSNMNGIAIDNE